MLLAPPNALVAGSWPASLVAQQVAAPDRSQVCAHSIHQEVIRVRPLPVDAELALILKIGHPSARAVARARLPAPQRAAGWAASTPAARLHCIEDAFMRPFDMAGAFMTDSGPVNT
jgi:hypothetical protein